MEENFLGALLDEGSFASNAVLVVVVVVVVVVESVPIVEVSDISCGASPRRGEGFL